MKKIFTLGIILAGGLCVHAADSYSNFKGNINNSSSMNKTYKSVETKNNTNQRKQNNYNKGNYNNKSTSKYSGYQKTSQKPIVKTVVKPIVKPVIVPVHQPVRPVIVQRPIIQTRPVVRININRPIYTPPVRNTINYPTFNFEDLIYTIKNQRFESDRLSVARQAIAENQFSTYQIMDLMSLFDFEESRLVIAKDAYFACVDTGNYYRINELFKFSSSVRDLEAFILSMR